MFTCSPVADDEKNLVKLAKRMRKNNISIDVIAFGNIDDDTVKKLESFNENVKGGEGSHLAVIPPGPNLLSDIVITTPILAADGVGGAVGMAAAGGEATADGGNQFEFGVDPSMDPELALALRMSFEEEKARQERERKEIETSEGKMELEGIPEVDETKPLLDESGEASGSGSAEATNKKEGDKPKDGDEMDTS